MNTNTPKFNERELQLIENFCKVEKSPKAFGTLQAKKYIGNKNFSLAFLNELKADEGKKYIGSLQAIDEKGKTFWYLQAIDGETYRILEPTEGIDELFDIEFKRVKAE